jgi:hypothetical protein
MSGDGGDKNNSDEDTIECGRHGSAHATYVCRCLIAQPLQRWRGELPDEENPWPDAWCGRCNIAFEREGGEWNERNEGAAKIALLCHRCYEDKRGESVQRLKGRALKRWQRFVEDCCDELVAKQEAMVREFALDVHERWDYDQTKAELLFSNAGVPAVRADYEAVGTLSTSGGTWLWSWGNAHTLAAARSRIGAVRECGRQEDWPHLAERLWPADEHDAQHMAAAAVHVLGARGFYRVPYERGCSYMALMALETLR